jgi:hypothetical protein
MTETEPVERAPAVPAATEATPLPAAQPASSLIERASEVRSDAIPAPAPRAADEAAIPKRFELPPDMVMIETSSETRRQPEQPVESSDEPDQPRRPRKSPPSTMAQAEPLVQIETRK